MADWIQKAIQHPGAFTQKAKSAKMGTLEYATKVLKKNSEASAKTKKQANLAKTLSNLRGK